MRFRLVGVGTTVVDPVLRRTRWFSFFCTLLDLFHACTRFSSPVCPLFSFLHGLSKPIPRVHARVLVVSWTLVVNRWVQATIEISIHSKTSRIPGPSSGGRPGRCFVETEDPHGIVGSHVQPLRKEEPKGNGADSSRDGSNIEQELDSRSCTRHGNLPLAIWSSFGRKPSSPEEQVLGSSSPAIGSIST